MPVAPSPPVVIPINVSWHCQMSPGEAELPPRWGSVGLKHHSLCLTGYVIAAELSMALTNTGPGALRLFREKQSPCSPYLPSETGSGYT